MNKIQANAAPKGADTPEERDESAIKEERAHRIEKALHRSQAAYIATVLSGGFPDGPVGELVEALLTMTDAYLELRDEIKPKS